MMYIGAYARHCTLVQYHRPTIPEARYPVSSTESQGGKIAYLCSGELGVFALAGPGVCHRVRLFVAAARWPHGPRGDCASGPSPGSSAQPPGDRALVAISNPVLAGCERWLFLSVMWPWGRIRLPRHAGPTPSPEPPAVVGPVPVVRDCMSTVARVPVGQFVAGNGVPEHMAGTAHAARSPASSNTAVTAGAVVAALAVNTADVCLRSRQAQQRRCDLA